MKHHLWFILSLAHLCTSEAADPSPEKPPYLGVFSNQADGFNTKALIIAENGKGFYLAAVAGAPVLWKHNPATNEITLTGRLGENHMIKSIVVRFDPAKRELTILDPKYAGGSRPLRHITDDIPQQYRDGLKNDGGDVKGK